MPFARYKLCPERQLVGSQAHSFFRVGLAHTFHLEQNLAGTDDRDPVIRRAFAFAHTGFGRLLGHRLVWKETKPNFAAALYETRHSNTARFDLAVGDIAAFEDLQSVVPKGQVGTAPGLTGHASPLLL